MMRIQIFVLAVMLALAACGTSSNGNGRTTGGTDGGSVGTTGGTDGGSGSTTGGTDGGTGTATGSPCTEGTTEPCTGSTEGTCDPGTRTCVGGAWGPCEGRSQPQPGLCEFQSCAGGLNPGCACKLGDTQECHTQDAKTLGHGPCTSGFQTCIAIQGGSKWGDCVGEVVPATEDCSGRDLACTGTTTPGGTTCNCTNGQTRACGGVSGGTCQLGTQTCSGGTWGPCEGEVQPAKGDCANPSCLSTASNQVPNPGCECVIGATEPCYTGPFGTENAGTCKAGTRTCNDAGQWGACELETRPVQSCDVPSCAGTPLPGCQ